ncbi:MAG: aspartate aminotransferase family protein [Candidatus Thermoplasmatota archaeon]|nr:aspartate aminotransferase family protein [Candidatus Thermoplasmatota archaeon]
MNFKEVEQIDSKYHFQIYGRLPILLKKGKGSHVWDSDGNEYIDVLGGIAVNSLGHCHPNVVNAIKKQAEQLIHCTNIYYIEPQVKLEKLLLDNCDMDRALFVNSGTEAVESAIKLARKWAGKHGKGGGIITMEGSFHGRSIACVTATGQKKYRVGFDPLPSGFKTVPFNDLQAVEEAIDDSICAVMVEPVQGEGGIVPADKTYLKELRDLCDKHNILLIFDEIQCGMARTGHLFAYQGYNVIPDMITIAKALGGGFPIGALLAKEEIANAFDKGDHGTTFGGNPLATAAAYASVSTLIDENFAQQAQLTGTYLMNRLNEERKKTSHITEVRGKGLMVGIVLDREGKEIVPEMMKRGVLANCTAKNVIRFVPPLNISEKDLDTAVTVLVNVIEEVFSDDN